MELREAVQVLAVELGAASDVGVALREFLTQYELELYRQSAAVADPLMLAKSNGRAEGVNLALKHLTQHIPNSPLRAPGAL